MDAQTDLEATTAIVVTCPGVTHYTVGYAMLASGLLVGDGFGQLTDRKNTVVLIPREGVDQSTVLARLATELAANSTEGRV